MDRTDRIGTARAASLGAWMLTLIVTTGACSSTPSPGPPGPAPPRSPSEMQETPPAADPGGAEYTVLVGPGEAPLFEPSALSIKAGETVRWDFASEGHSVISGVNGMADGKFCAPNNQGCAQAPVQEAGVVYAVKFPRAGSYPYFCGTHLSEGMTGTVTVTP